MDKSGIYSIRNLENSQLYIGSSKNLYNRLRSHLLHLKNNKHANPKLQNSWNKYGEDVFEFKVIEFCTIEILINREQYWMDNLNTISPNGFNILAIAGTPRGIKRGPMSQETKDKISLAHIGRKHSEESRNNMKEGQKNKWLNNIELRKKMSIIASDRIFTIKTREKLSTKSKGRFNKKVINTITGEIFESIELAAKFIGMKYSRFAAMLRGQNKNKTNMKYYE